MIQGIEQSIGVVVQVMEKMISSLIAKLLASFWDWK